MSTRMNPRARKPLGGRGTNQYAVRGQSVDNSGEESDNIKEFSRFSTPPSSSVRFSSSSEELKSALAQLRDAIASGDDSREEEAERSIRDNSSPAYASALIDHENAEASRRESEYGDIADHAQGTYLASEEDLEPLLSKESPESARMASLIMSSENSDDRSETYMQIEEERRRMNMNRLSRIGL